MKVNLDRTFIDEKFFSDFPIAEALRDKPRDLDFAPGENGGALLMARMLLDQMLERSLGRAALQPALAGVDRSYALNQRLGDHPF